MRLIISALVLVAIAVLYLGQKTPIQEPKPEAKPQPKINAPPLAAEYLKAKKYDAFLNNFSTLSATDQAPYRKKITLSLLNALRKGDDKALIALHKAYLLLPEEPKEKDSINHLLSLYDVDKFLNNEPILNLVQSSKIKETLDHLIVLFLPLESPPFPHLTALLDSPYISEDEKISKKAFLANLSEVFKHDPQKALALVELSPSFTEELVPKLATKDNLQALNQYLAYASQRGIEVPVDVSTKSLFDESTDHFYENDHENTLLKLELLSRIDANQNEIRKAYAQVLFDAKHYKAALLELNELDRNEPEILEIYALAKLFEKDPSGLEILKSLPNISENDAFRFLAQNYYSEKQYEKALDELNRINDPNSDDMAIKAVIFSRQKRFEESQNLLSLIDPNLQTSQAIKTIAIENTLALSKYKEAAEIAANTPTSYSYAFPYLSIYAELENEHPYHSSLAYKNDNDHEKALALLEKADSSFKIEIEKAELNYKAKQFDKALDAILKAQSLKNESATKEQNIAFEKWAALTFLEVGEPLDAFIHFNKLDKLVDDPETYQAQIQTFIEVERYDLAEKKAALIKADSAENQVLNLFLSSYLDREIESDEIIKSLVDNFKTLPSKSQKLFVKTLPIYQKEPEAKRLISLIESPIDQFELFTYFGDYNKADELLAKVKGEDTLESWLALAKYYDRMSDDVNTELALKNALRIKPYDFALQSALYAYQDELTEQMSDKQKENVSKYPDWLSAQYLLARLNLIEGVIKEQNDSKSYFRFPWEKADGIAASLLEKYPELPSLYLLQGETKILLNQLLPAKNALSKGLELANVSTPLSQFKAEALNQLKKNKEAIETLNMALDYDPYNPDLIYTYGSLEEIRGNYLEVIESYQKYIELKPNDPKGYIALTKLYKNINLPESAVETLSKLLEIDPNNTKAKTLLKNLIDDPNLNISSKEYKRLKILSK